MAQLLQISASTKLDINEVGDVIGVFEDTHKFTDYEKQVFTITKVDGDKATVQMLMEAVTPKVTTAYKAATTEWTEEPPEEKQVWEKDGEKYDLVNPPNYKLRYVDGKFENNFERDPVNLTTKIIPKITEVELSK